MLLTAVPCCLQAAFGCDAMLGPLDENDPDMADDDDDDAADVSMEGEEDDELVAALSKTTIQ